MGSIYLAGQTPGYAPVVDVLRAAGVDVVTYAGYETRSRSSGGFEALLGILPHHTASSTTPANDVNYCINGPDAPIANCLLDRTGLLHVYACGASNHAGKGGGSAEGGGAPWHASKGTIPADSANSRTWGIEAANAGTGAEPWPEAQQSAYVRICTAICSAYGLDPLRDIRSHAEWTDRKVDPKGPSRWSEDDSRPWAMDGFRADVAAGTLPAPTPGGQQVLTIFEPTDAGAAFIGFSDRGFGHTVSWISNPATLEVYRKNGFPTQKLPVSDFKGLWLVGPLPVGDHRHEWTAADFAP